jgi:poly(3-hydroxybutyrate) depolymerase
MKSLATFFVFLSFSLPGYCADAVKKEFLEIQGERRTFYLFVPEGLNISNPAPLVILLHGSGRTGLSLVEKWTELAKRERFIIVGPDSKESRRGWLIPDDGPDLLRAIVENVSSRFPVNTRALYLFGHSAGAMFALSMSLLESEFFAATAIHAGALDENGHKAIPYAKRKIPIAIYVGTKDHLFSVEVVRATRNTLAERGFVVSLTEIPNHNHWYYDLAPKINAVAWDFLKKHTVKQARYQTYQFK